MPGVSESLLKSCSFRYYYLLCTATCFLRCWVAEDEIFQHRTHMLCSARRLVCLPVASVSATCHL
jgi:hypothetical protein